MCVSLKLYCLSTVLRPPPELPPRLGERTPPTLQPSRRACGRRLTYRQTPSSPKSRDIWVLPTALSTTDNLASVRASANRFTRAIWVVPVCDCHESSLVAETVDSGKHVLNWANVFGSGLSLIMECAQCYGMVTEPTMVVNL